MAPDTTSEPRIRLGLVIVDDEAPARQLIREYVSRDERLEILAECGGGAEAIELLRNMRPCVVLLDIQMPGVDGFEVLAQADCTRHAVVMVTAYNEHALRAFDHHALDYVLKPIEESRLRLALDRAVVRLVEGGEHPAPAGLRDLIGSLGSESKVRARIVLKCTGSILFLEPDELPWIEAAGNYLKVEVAGKEYLVRDSMTRLIERLDPALFFRIHRSYVVNRAHVLELKPLPGGSDYVIVLRQGKALPVGRSYRQDVMEWIGL